MNSTRIAPNCPKRPAKKRSTKVVFFLNPQPTTEKQSIKTQSKGIVNVLVVVLLAAAFSWVGVYMAHSNLKDEFIRSAWVNQLFLVSMLVVFVTSIWLLIKNKRFFLTIAVWLSLAITLVSLFFYTGPHDVRDYCIGARNWFFMSLILYPFIHLLVHGLAKLFKHDRNIMTPEGLVNYHVLLVIATFLWGIYDWVLRVI